MSEYLCRDEGGSEEKVEADSMEEALDLAADWAREGDWGDGSETVYVTVYVFGPDEEQDSVTVTIEPEEPSCSGEKHDWKPENSGCDENPGVFGHGGGVIIREVCRHCGTTKVTDTWAQNRSTGEEGLTEVSYEASEESV
jgi:hypothetical protein